jgi:hypothetical protein
MLQNSGHLTQWECIKDNFGDPQTHGVGDRHLWVLLRGLWAVGVCLCVPVRDLCTKLDHDEEAGCHQ